MAEFRDLLCALGECGLYQKLLVLLLSLPLLFNPFQMVGQVFMVVEVPYHCDTSWIRAVGPNLTEEEQLNLTLPRGTDGQFEQCSMYSPVDWDLDSILAYGLNDTEKCTNGWVYPSGQPPSLLTEFDLVCERAVLNDVSQSIYMAGLLIGAMFFGMLSDRIGRRPVLLICMFIQSVLGLGIAFVPHFYVFIAFRCVVGAAVSGIMITVVSLGTEWVGVSYRPKAVLIAHTAFAIGQMTVAGLSYGIRNWRLLEIVGSAPMFALFFFIWVLPESARWLVTKGRIEEAKKLLQKAAATNKRSLPPELLEQLKPEKEAKSGSFLDLFREKNQRKITLIMSCIWFADSIVYYGLSLSVTDFGLDIYLTQLAFGAVELPARLSLIFLLEWFGRKKVQGTLLLLSGLLCLILTGIPAEQALAITVLAVIGKMTSTAAFSTSYVYAAEVFPTVIRQTGVGLCSTMARVAGILAPLIIPLGQYHQAIPMAIFGSIPVVVALFCILLPETRGVDLADNTGEERITPETKKQAKTVQDKNWSIAAAGQGKRFSFGPRSDNHQELIRQECRSCSAQAETSGKAEPTKGTKTSQLQRQRFHSKKHPVFSGESQNFLFWTPVTAYSAYRERYRKAKKTRKPKNWPKQWWCPMVERPCLSSVPTQHWAAFIHSHLQTQL
ncbi:Solute carrier family 22 member 13, partial [Lamprotornis superbus]